MENTSKREKRRTGDWLRQHAEKQKKFFLLASILMIPVTLFVHLVTFWFFWMLLAFTFFDFSGVAGLIAATAIVVLLHPLYLLTPRDQLDRVQLPSTKSKIMVERETGFSVVGVFSGPSHLSTAIRMLIQLLLVAPATLWFGVRLFHMSRRWAQLDNKAVSSLLRELLKTDGRVSLSYLMESRYSDDEKARAAFSDLLIFDDILILGTEDGQEPSLLLGSGLREDIIKWKRGQSDDTD